MYKPTMNEQLYLDEIQGFLRETSACLRIFALYPKGHPARGPALERTSKKIEDLLKDRGSVYFGVSEEELIVFTEDEKEHRLDTDLAGRLHQQGILTVKIDSGLTQNDLGLFLRCLSRAQQAISGDQSIQESLQEAGISKISLTMVDYRKILEQEPSAAPDQSHTDLWMALIRQGQEVNEGALRKMAGSFQDPSQYRIFRTRIQKSLEGSSAEGTPDISKTMSKIQQEIFSRLPSSEQETFSKNLAGLALSGEPASSGSNGGMEEALVNYSDEMLLHVLAGAVVLKGKIDNRISTTFQNVLKDKTREGSLLSIADQYAKKKSSAVYSPEVWEQIRKFILSGSEDQFMSHEYHQVLDHLHAYHLEDLRESIGMDYLHEVQSSLHPGVLKQIRREMLCDLILEETREDLIDGPLAELRSCLSEYARKRDMKQILKTLESVFHQGVQIPPLKKKKMDAALALDEESAWIAPLIREIGNMGSDDLSMLKKIFSYCRQGLPVFLVRQLGEERSIAGRKRLSLLLVDIGQDALPAIIPSLSDDRWFLVRNLVMILGKIGDPSRIEDLVPLLYSRDYRIQREVIYTLSSFGSDRAVHPIRKILLNRNNLAEPRLRTIAAQALKRIGTPKSRKVLQDGLEDRDKRVQEICCQVLKGLT